jgi:hypothetical protein
MDFAATVYKEGPLAGASFALNGLVVAIFPGPSRC